MLQFPSSFSCNKATTMGAPWSWLLWSWTSSFTSSTGSSTSFSSVLRVMMPRLPTSSPMSTMAAICGRAVVVICPPTFNIRVYPLACGVHQSLQRHCHTIHWTGFKGCSRTSRSCGVLLSRTVTSEPGAWWAHPWHGMDVGRHRAPWRRRGSPCPWHVQAVQHPHRSR